MPLDLRPYDSPRINQKGIFIVAAAGYCQRFVGHFIARISALLPLLLACRVVADVLYFLNFLFFGYFAARC